MNILYTMVFHFKYHGGGYIYYYVSVKSNYHRFIYIVIYYLTFMYVYVISASV
jgi:hypothetical protein